MYIFQRGVKKMYTQLTAWCITLKVHLVDTQNYSYMYNIRVQQ